MKIYFASDIHLGIAGKTSSAERERMLVAWLETAAKDATEIYLVGDVFDFWFEYKTVVPKGYLRLFGALARIRDQGIPVHFFTGNHDMWMFNYLQDELGIPVHRAPVIREWKGKVFEIGHGDGLGPGDHGYKLIKKIFASPICQWLFRWIHPDIGMRIANFWSGRSRAQESHPPPFLGAEKEWLVQYCETEIKTRKIDFFIFGHRHLPLDYTLSNGQSRYINLGDWLRFDTYAVFDGDTLALRTFEATAQ